MSWDGELWLELGGPEILGNTYAPVDVMFGKHIVQDVQDWFVLSGRRVDDHVNSGEGRGHGKQLL